LSGSSYPIDLWFCRASSQEPGPIETSCEASLCEEERRLADRFRRSTTRNQHVVGRGMARTLLSNGCVTPQEIEFELNAHGKPAVVAPAVARRPFNIAHTEGLVIFASCDQGHIGVDVERLSRDTDINLAKRYFAEPEVEFVMSQPDEEARRLAFIRVWTLKESFIKAIGKGLSIPLADFAFEAIDSQTPHVNILNEEWNDGSQWHFACVTPAEGYLASVALANAPQGKPIEVRLRDFHSTIGTV
jgi:4'-phosphopantetheinyl transferase